MTTEIPTTDVPITQIPTEIATEIPTRVSFVVPTRNAARTLGACLESIRAQDHSDVESIVVDNSSSDGTREIAEDLADVTVTFGPERSAQRNRGARLAMGSVLVFADADMVFEPSIAADVHRLLGESGDRSIGAVVLPELAFGAGFLARCRRFEKELYLGDPAVEAARGFRRAQFLAVGGYDESLTGPEDWELADRMRTTYGRLARSSARLWHDEGRIDLRQAFRKKRYYGHGLAAYFARDRRPLRRRALLQPQRLARHPQLTAGLAVLKTVELSGAALGIAEGRVRGAVR